MVPFQVLQGHLRPRLAGAAQAGSVERGQTLGATQQRPRSHRVVHVVVWSGDGGGVQRDPAEPSPLQEGGAPFGAGCGCLGLLFREHSRGLFRAGRQGRGTRGPSAGRRGPGLHGAGVRSRPGRRPGPPQSPRCQMPHSGLPRRREDGAVRPARPLGPCAPPSLSPQHPCLSQGGLYPAHFTGEGTGARRETHCCGLRVLSGTGGNRARRPPPAALPPAGPTAASGAPETGCSRRVGRCPSPGPLVEQAAAPPLIHLQPPAQARGAPATGGPAAPRGLWLCVLVPSAARCHWQAHLPPPRRCPRPGRSASSLLQEAFLGPCSLDGPCASRGVGCLPLPSGCVGPGASCVPCQASARLEHETATPWGPRKVGARLLPGHGWGATVVGDGGCPALGPGRGVEPRLTSLRERSCWDSRSRCRFPMRGSGCGPGGQCGSGRGPRGPARSSTQSPTSPRSPSTSASRAMPTALPGPPFCPAPYRPPEGCVGTPPTPPPRECGTSSLQGQPDSLK